MMVRHSLWRLLVACVIAAGVATPAFAKDTPTATTMPAQQGGSDEVTMLSASCFGCYAGWGLWEDGNTIRALRGSYTGEWLSFIHVHWAFINPEPDSCADMYDGSFVSTGTKEVSNTSVDQVKDSDYSQGGQHHWTNAGAHQWKDDGATWTVGFDGETDICKDFGF